MTTFNSETPIGHLVAKYPSSARLFDRLGVDYCCGGDRSLRTACAEEGLDADTVIRMLESDVDLDADDGAEGESTNWAAAPLDELIDHIEETHHAYLRRELPRLESLLEKVAHVHGTDAPWVVSVKEVFAELRPNMEAHIEKEEEVVFPFIRACVEEASPPSPDVLGGDPIALMEEEHDETGAALKRMRTLSHDFAVPEWGCNSFRAVMDGLESLETDTHRHVHKENSILFPRARALV
ncbi:iron-sulfur cluster repair di-iron protein [Salinibacter sp. 10B]|uniref:iron-sulfur cluster repair di-iron protein n=1 Tax=Salinibacter sp. 10B TaxID=1923971 RepID=UPI000CF4F61A|nr:iron-sulfur cluster repair di-iron protein [Salinibacter sp. 10B]PQJ35893.1 iron-sulfur cluster repair di-iron protein [Salinibacter sp. 10B]